MGLKITMEQIFSDSSRNLQNFEAAKPWNKFFIPTKAENREAAIPLQGIEAVHASALQETQAASVSGQQRSKAGLSILDSRVTLLDSPQLMVNEPDTTSDQLLLVGALGLAAFLYFALLAE